MNLIGKIENGEFVPYANLGGEDQKGVPVFVFENEAEWEIEYNKGNVPDGSVIITPENETTIDPGTPVESELSETSVNPVQNKVITSYINGIMTLKNPVSFQGGAGYHNSIFRGKYLGDHVTDEQYATITSGEFNDLYIGDYWTINENNWRIAHFDYWFGCGDTPCTTHHIVIVPDNSLYALQMNSSSSGVWEEGDANLTNNGYIGSYMYITGLNQAKTVITNAFGSSHILSHREMLVTLADNGIPTGNSWYDSTVELMNEPMVYGSYIFSPQRHGDSHSYLYTIDKTQFALFNHDAKFIRSSISSNTGSTYWLRDTVSNYKFANVSFQGFASCDDSTWNLDVRPTFGIC